MELNILSLIGMGAIAGFVWAATKAILQTHRHDRDLDRVNGDLWDLERRIDKLEAKD